MNSYDEEDMGKPGPVGEGESMVKRGLDSPKMTADEMRERSWGVRAERDQFEPKVGKKKVQLGFSGRGVGEPKKKDQTNGFVEFANKVQDVVVNKELLEKWKGCTKGLPNLSRTADAKDVCSQEKHPKGCDCSYCDEAPKVDMTDKPVGYQGYWDRPIPEWKTTETYTLKSRTEDEELAELAKIKDEDANAPELGHPQFAEDAEEAVETWDGWLRSCMEGYVSSVGNPRHNGYYEEKSKIKGLLIFYINVGQLSPSNAEAMVDRMKDKLKAVTERLPEDWESIWLPVRDGQTRIEKVIL